MATGYNMRHGGIFKSTQHGYNMRDGGIFKSRGVHGILYTVTNL